MDVFNGRSLSKEDLRVWGALRLGLEGVGGLSGLDYGLGA